MSVIAKDKGTLTQVTSAVKLTITSTVTQMQVMHSIPLFTMCNAWLLRDTIGSSKLEGTSGGRAALLLSQLEQIAQDLSQLSFDCL